MSTAPKKHLCIIEEGQKSDIHGLNGLDVAKIGEQIVFEPAVLDVFNQRGCLPIHFDLFVLCAAIEFADRCWKRPQGWCRTIELKIPVIELQSWNRAEVVASLHKALNRLTGDVWLISFVQANNTSPIRGQRSLTLPNSGTLVLAYSDGLDSRAISALSGSAEEVLRVRVSKSGDKGKKGDSPFEKIPFNVKGHGSKESSDRSRGFRFACMTAIVAHLSNLSRIIVPESGQGALGPVLSPLHKIDADYRNHPVFFRKMERFIHALLGHQVTYEQPRLWFTKGQTLQAFLNLEGKKDSELTGTRSCWQKRRVVNKNGQKQCGLCASCLLRRMSMNTAGVREREEAYRISDLSSSDVSTVLSDLKQGADRKVMIEYGIAGARHFQHLADMANFPDEKLDAHVREIADATGVAFEETLSNLRGLLNAHAEEWRSFITAQGKQSFLNSWIKGGRHV